MGWVHHHHIFNITRGGTIGGDARQVDPDEKRLSGTRISGFNTKKRSGIKGGFYYTVNIVSLLFSIFLFFNLEFFFFAKRRQ